jgi:hypothetical protein
MNKKNKLRGKKAAMIEALKNQLGNVTVATKQVGIERTTHYLWLRTDPIYKKAYEEVPELILDAVEHSLQKNIIAGNVVAQIFYLKTKGKHRGYIEESRITQEITQKTISLSKHQVEINHIINKLPKADRDKLKEQLFVELKK